MSAESTSSSTLASQSEAHKPIQSDQQDSVLSKGKLLLSLLSQKAAAARAEAQIAELRLLLIEAQSGNSQRLTHWLDCHTAEVHQELSPADFETAMLEPEGPNLAGPAVDPITSWSALLPDARNRLQLRAELLRSGKPVKDASLWRSTPVKSLRMDLQHTNAEPNEAQARSFDSEELHEKEEQQNRQRVVSRLGGLVASIVAHVLLVVFLAFFTLRLPTPPASLAFETSSSEIATETLEISEPLDVSAPESQEASEAIESFDVTESLAEVTSTVGSTLGDLASVSQKSLPSAAAAAIAAVSPGPTNTNSSFFGAAASGNCFCYIIDGSGSMRNGPWEAAKLELLKSLASLKEKQRFYIIFFNQELSAIPLPGDRNPAPRALYATSENLEHARRWLDTLRIDIGAPPREALKLGIEKEPDAIYLLTDGVTKVDVPKFLRDENRIDDLVFGEQVRVPIHTIAFYSLEGQEMLKQIASENKGQFIYVPDPRKR